MSFSKSFSGLQCRWNSPSSSRWINRPRVVAPNRVSASATTVITTSAREDLAVEVGAELAQGLAAAGLLLAVPGQDGRLEDPSLVAGLLVQRDVPGFDAGHDVGSGDADEVGRVLGANCSNRNTRISRNSEPAWHLAEGAGC